MLVELKKLNPDIDIYSIRDVEFKKYGRVIDYNASEIVEKCIQIGWSMNGSSYTASVDELENLEDSKFLKAELFGGCAAQTGLCCGTNNMLNGLEYHKSSEINVAVTPLVLILGLQYEMEGNEYDSKNVKAFYLEKGDVVEVFGTSMHFCPCQVSDEGFSALVVLPKDTNTELDKKTDDKLLFKKNKWIICHYKNKSLIERGVYPGIHGVNYEIKYK